MYHYSKLIKNDYGFDFYKLPVHHTDPRRQIEARENYEYNTFSKKRPPPRKLKPEEIPKRGGLDDEIKKKAQATPGPWSYNLGLKWIRGPNAKEPEENVPKDKQKIKFLWQSVPKDQRQYKKPKNEKLKKPDMNVNRGSYIDHIFKKGKDKNYPLPGPGAHFLDEKLLKKIKDGDIAQKMKRPKTSTGRPDIP